MKKKQIEAANNGILVVLYKGQEWNALELIEELAKEVAKLKRKQCKPSARCLFEGQKYLDKKYTPAEYPTEFKLLFY